METLRGSIKSYAFEYLGQEENKGNMGFKDPEFDKKMKEIGMVDGYAWCCLFTELCWVEAYKEFAPEMLPILKKEFSAGTVRTFRHFKSIKWTSKVPEEGDIVIWQTYKKGKAKTTGHAAIVMEVNGKSIMGIMMLAAEPGSEIRIITDGEDENDAMNALKELIENKFYEED